MIRVRVSSDLDDDVGDHVSSLIPAIGGVAHVTVDLAQFQHFDHVGDIFRSAEEVSQGFPVILAAMLRSSFSSVWAATTDNRQDSTLGQSHQSDHPFILSTIMSPKLQLANQSSNER